MSMLGMLELIVATESQATSKIQREVRPDKQPKIIVTIY